MKSIFTKLIFSCVVLIYSDKLCAQSIEGTSVNVKDSWDGVYTTTYGNKQYNLIGTYQGWDPEAIYFAGYNTTNSSNNPTKRIFFGGGSVGQGFTYDIVNQNLGLGTASPSAKLTVTPNGPGGIIIGNPTTNANNYTSLSLGINAEKNGYSYLQSVKSAGSSYGNIVLNELGGNVGIGTQSPEDKLHINNGSLYINSGIDNNHIYWQGHPMTMGTKPGDYAHNFLILKPGGAAQGKLNSIFQMFDTNSISNSELKVDIRSEGSSFFNGGNVGIGTTQPLAKLHINGLTIFSAMNANIDPNLNAININFLANTGSTLVGWNRSGGSGETDFVANRGAGGSGGFSFYDHTNTNQTNHLMRISGNGDVGIGTQNPDAKLTVRGTIHANEVRIDTSVPAPDYVFKKDYDLKSLSEVEGYIKANSHLPEVPSATELERKGIKLSEMSMLLLKKVEELTLHLIEKDKELQNQRIFNTSLLNRIENIENIIR